MHKFDLQSLLFCCDLDSLDIQSTVEVDKKMESERLLAIDGLMESLLLSMVKNGDITRYFDITRSPLNDLSQQLSNACLWKNLSYTCRNCVPILNQSVFFPEFKQ